MKKCIVIANGKGPKKNLILYFQKLGYSTLICADGGANSLLKLKLTPDYIIGDLDSIDQSTLDSFASISKVIKIKRQNDTDVEKCLKFAIKNKMEDVILFGATGDRLDHTICNIGIVLKFFDRIKIRIIHDKSILSAYSGKVLFDSVVGETISLYGFDRKTTITSRGLKYPLKKTALPFGVRESTSNVAAKNMIELDIKNGTIFVIRDFETMRINGLI